MAISRTRAREAGRPVREGNNGFGKISPELIIIISNYAVQEEAHCIAHILIVLLFAHGHQLTNKVAIKVGPKCVQNQLLLPVHVTNISSSSSDHHLFSTVFRENNNTIS